MFGSKIVNLPIWNRKFDIVLVIVFAVGIGLRFYGLFWDWPYFFNPDEKRLIEWGREFNYLKPMASEWGTLPQLIIKLIEITLNRFYLPAKVDIYVIARGLAAFLGSLTIILVFLLTKQNYSRQSALYAAIFTTFTVLLIQDAHFYRLDGIFALCTLIALFPMMAVGRTGTTKSYIFAGVAIGLAASVRINGYLLLLPLFVAHCNQLMTDQGAVSNPKISTGWWRSKPFANLIKSVIHKKLLLAGLLSIIIFITLTPAAVLDTQKYLFHDGLVWVMLQSSGYLKSRYTLQFESTRPYFYFSKLLFWSAGPFLLLAYLAGAIQPIAKWRQKENLIILSFLFLYLWLGAGARVKFIRYALPILPLLNVIAANFFASVVSLQKAGGRQHGLKVSEQTNYASRHLALTPPRIIEKIPFVQEIISRRSALRWGGTIWLSATIVGSALYALAFVNIYSLPDPRILASE